MGKLIAFFFLLLQISQLSLSLGAELFVSQQESNYTSPLNNTDSEESETGENEFCHRPCYIDGVVSRLATSFIIQFPLADFIVRQSFVEIQTPPPELV
jgi:hypothetical protein